MNQTLLVVFVVLFHLFKVYTRLYEEMFAIVQFTNSVKEIHPLTSIKRLTGGNCVVKYRGASYEGKILGVTDKQVLEPSLFANEIGGNVYYSESHNEGETVGKHEDADPTFEEGNTRNNSEFDDEDADPDYVEEDSSNEDQEGNADLNYVSMLGKNNTKSNCNGNVEMFAIVQFTNSVKEIHPLSSIKRLAGGNCFVKYRGASYEGKILGVTDKQVLEPSSFANEIEVNIDYSESHDKGETVGKDEDADPTFEEGNTRNNSEFDDEDADPNSVEEESSNGDQEENADLNYVSMLGKNNSKSKCNVIVVLDKQVLEPSSSANEIGGNVYYPGSHDEGETVGNHEDADPTFEEGNIRNDSEFDDEDADPDYIEEDSSNEDQEENADLNYVSMLGKNNTKSNCNETEYLTNANSEPISNGVPNGNCLNNDEINNSLFTTINNGGVSSAQIHMVVSSSTKCKQYFCCYCLKLTTKFARHLELCHKDEKEVKVMLSFQKGSDERHKIIHEIRTKSNFLFNTKSALSDGYLIPVRRPQNKCKRSVKSYKPCPECHGFYSKTSIRRHYLKCNKLAKKGNKDLLPLARNLQGQIHKKASAELRNVFFKMREDKICDVLKFDEMAILYGNYLCSKYRKVHFQAMIRSKLRLLGRLLIALIEINSEISSFTYALQPQMYDTIIEAVNKVALLGENTVYKAPSTAAAIGTLLKKCTKLLISEYIKQDNDDSVRRTKNFLCILEEDFPCSVSKTVEENQNQQKRLKKVVLPSMEDIKLLNNFLNKERKLYFNLLNEKFDYNYWKCLSEVTLIAVQIFNRRRAGEIERLAISDFEAYQSIDDEVDEDILNSLSEETKRLGKQYVRLEIRGKLGRTVPVLLHTDLVKCIRLILSYRKEAKVSEGNPFVFALPGGNDKYLRACVLLRKFSYLCGAKNPNSLRGTELRKHIATRSGLINLQEHEVSDLASFLGHADKIHKEHYRMPTVTRDIVRMSQLLQVVQGDRTVKDMRHDLEITDTEEKEKHSKICSDTRDDIEFTDMGEIEINPKKSSDMRTDIELTDAGEIDKISKKRSVSPVGYVKRHSWGESEKRVVNDVFHRYISSKTLPSTDECLNAIEEYSLLQTRSPQQLKSFISNQIKKQRCIKRKRETVNYWTVEEKEIMREEFKEHLNKRQLPSYIECIAASKKYPVLKIRTKQTIKAWVYNEIKKLKRN